MKILSRSTFRPFDDGALSLAAVASLGSCSDTCLNREIARIDAPGWQRSAVLFDRTCGATTGFSTQISIVGRGESPSGGGNVFRADTNHGLAQADEWGGPRAEIRWLAADHLVVRYAARSRIFEQGVRVSGVRVSYQAVDR